MRGFRKDSVLMKGLFSRCAFVFLLLLIFSGTAASAKPKTKQTEKTGKVAEGRAAQYKGNSVSAESELLPEAEAGGQMEAGSESGASGSLENGSESGASGAQKAVGETEAASEAADEGLSGIQVSEQSAIKRISSEITTTINEIPFPEEFLEEKTQHPLEWFLNFDHIFIFRTIESVTDTPYFTMAFPFTVGFVFPADTKLNFQPKISFFSEYFLWDGNNAFPAKQEDSTNIAFCFLIDLPANYTYTLKEKHIFEGKTGPSFDIRFSKTMNGLNSSDESAGGTVAEDVREINSLFWKNANFLYWNFSLSYMYAFVRGIKAGPEARFYIPLGSVLSGNGMNGYMISAGLKVRF